MTLGSHVDSERQKVYDAERAAFGPGGPLAEVGAQRWQSLANAAALVAQWWADLGCDAVRNATRPQPAPSVRMKRNGARGGSHADYSANSIAMSATHVHTWVLVHELAHHVTHWRERQDREQHRDPGHAARFRVAYCDVVRVAFPDDPAAPRRLADAFRAAGLSMDPAEQLARQLARNDRTAARARELAHTSAVRWTLVLPASPGWRAEYATRTERGHVETASTALHQARTWATPEAARNAARNAPRRWQVAAVRCDFEPRGTKAGAWIATALVEREQATARPEPVAAFEVVAELSAELRPSGALVLGPLTLF